MVKSYGCLKFLREVQVGRACVGANLQELTTLRARERNFFLQRVSLGHPATANGQSLVTNRPKAHNLTDYRFVPLFWQFFSFFFCTMMMGWHFGRMGAQHSLAPTFGSVKSSILHGAWKFPFFFLFLLKLEFVQTFISTVGILVS